MNELFLKIINRGISASWLILAVLILRIVLKKAPKWVHVLLWGIVAVRLIFPFSVESAWSLIPSAETIPMDIETDAMPAIDSGINTVNRMINPIISASLAPHEGDSANPLQVWFPLAFLLWILGMAVLLLYAAVSYWRLRQRVDTAVLYKDNIYQSENVDSPFVLGIIRPGIYLPFKVSGQGLEQVVAHEQAHIRRHDHWWKPLGFLLLAVHWFNPLMWLAYALLCRDIELACDEKVIRELDNEQRADYTQALVDCSANRRIIAVCPLAFGEVGVKERVKSVMNYKRPAFWMILLSLVVCAVAAVCFLTNPKRDHYSLKIVVPAGSQEAVVYADEEISPLGDYISVTSGDGLGDTEVSLKTVEVKTETAYDAPVYLTPGMPVRMEAEKGGWFKIGVNVQNHTDEEIVVYINVENVEVRIGDKASSDAAGTMVDNDNAAGAMMDDNDAAGAMMDDDNAAGTMMDDNDNAGAMSNDRDDGETMMNGHKGGGEKAPVGSGSEAALTEASLRDAIYKAILDHNELSRPDGLYHCASFVLLGQQELCIDSEPPTPMQVTVYGLALYQGYKLSDTGIYEGRGSHTPVAITFEVEEGEYSLAEYWEPGDGSYYVKDIREKFPDTIEDDAMDTQKYILAQKQDCYAQAVEYGRVDTDSVIGQLFETIESSPAHSSNPGDYVHEHSIEYRELTWYGQYTLRYCFERFSQGDQKGLHGHIMALVCQDIMLAWGEEYAVDQELFTGQDWFDAFKSDAESLAAQYSQEELAKYYPGAWLYLQS